MRVRMRRQKRPRELCFFYADIVLREGVLATCDVTSAFALTYDMNDSLEISKVECASCVHLASSAIIS